MTKLSVYLKRKKKAEGITKCHFAKKIGVTPVYLYKLEKGQVIPTIKTALKIQKATEDSVTLYDWVKLEKT